MSLLDIQQAFHQAIYTDDNRLLESLIDSDADFLAQERIAVYQNNTLGSLKEVIRHTYPVCVQLVGEKYFAQLANYYVSQTPSTQPNLDCYGAGFASCLNILLQQREELQPLAYLPDVARLEWALHQSYYAVNRTAFDLAGFAALPADQQTDVCFTLAEDIILLQSAYAVYAIWQQHQSSDHPYPDIAAADDQGLVLVVRDEFKPTPIAIEPTLYHLLSALQQQRQLAGLAAYLAQSPLSLAAMIQRGWIIGYKVST